MAGKSQHLTLSGEEDEQLRQALLEALDLLGAIRVNSSVGEA
jgi:hypothetical protein